MGSKKRFLITGGAGFIGSNIALRLLEEGKFVRVLDNFLTGRRENIEGFAQRFGKNFDLVTGDLRERGLVADLCEGIDFVLHQGALPSVPRSVEDPLLSNDINIGGTLNVLLGAKERGVKRVVFASSSSIYGDTEELPKHEKMSPLPKSPYALQKLTGENYCRLFFELFGVNTVVLRYFNVFGPKQDPASMYAAVIPKFISALLNGKKPVVFGDGKQTRDFTYIDNVVRANISACYSPPSSCGKVINVGCRRRYSLLQLLANLEQIVGTRVEPVFEAPVPGDVRDSMADISLAEKYLDFKISIGFMEGLEKTVEWFKESSDKGM